MNPYQVVRDFEAAVCNYTGAPYCVAVNSCSMALLLAVAWHLRMQGPRVGIEIPRRTYVSVPMSIIHAGGWPLFRDEDWQGWYQLEPLPVWDSARWFTSGMYRGLAREAILDPGSSAPTLGDAIVPVDCSGHMLCVSFHASKILGDTQGGAILHDDKRADDWFRRARFDGRAEGVAPKDDIFPVVGWHCYMSPDVAARLLLRLLSLIHI